MCEHSLLEEDSAVWYHLASSPQVQSEFRRLQDIDSRLLEYQKNKYFFKECCT